MTATATIHATCVAIDGKGVLLRGPSGSGKSDLALRLIDGGAILVADDYVVLTESGEQLLAGWPESTRGLLEVRGVGLVRVPCQDIVPVSLIVDLVLPADVVRLPETEFVCLSQNPGIVIQRIQIAPFEASSPAKIRLMLRAAVLGDADMGQ
ncbi:MAG: HPr kinase/phosphatase C-terminal domain-containing protein [Proteobacteria bacterium]|nr:HPr kinase/phosphatase C-terminal domain-containing protein [Pseudomonadota bacterium]